MRFLFVMDPAEKMIPDKDTSFAFLRAAHARGHETLHCEPNRIRNLGSDVFATVRTITVSDSAPHVTFGTEANVALADLDAIFIRKDPPFDSAYVHLTQQLDLVKHLTLVLNDPQGLRNANEKLFAFHFARHMPRSLVTSEMPLILDFLREVGGQGVLKPLDGAGGSGVVAVSTTDKNTRALIDLLSHEGRELVLIQEFIPAITEGDKRVIVLDGEPLGAILRVPRSDDIRANIHVGGQVHATELTATEREVVEDVGVTLKKEGLYFVGLDLIGGKLIEVNVTSPTGIQELGRFLGTKPEENVIAWVEARAKQLGSR